MNTAKCRESKRGGLGTRRRVSLAYVHSLVLIWNSFTTLELTKLDVTLVENRCSLLPLFSDAVN